MNGMLNVKIWNLYLFAQLNILLLHLEWYWIYLKKRNLRIWNLKHKLIKDYSSLKYSQLIINIHTQEKKWINKMIISKKWMNSIYKNFRDFNNGIIMWNKRNNHHIKSKRIIWWDHHNENIEDHIDHLIMNLLT